MVLSYAQVSTPTPKSSQVGKKKRNALYLCALLNHPTSYLKSTLTAGFRESTKIVIPWKMVIILCGNNIISVNRKFEMGKNLVFSIPVQQCVCSRALEKLNSKFSTRNYYVHFPPIVKFEFWTAGNFSTPKMGHNIKQNQIFESRCNFLSLTPRNIRSIPQCYLIWW